MWVVVLVACNFLAGPPIPQPVVDKIGGELSGLGHPNADFVEAKITGWQATGGGTVSHNRYVDVDITYQRKKETGRDVMTVRLYLESVAPCRVSTDVLDDTGPKPVLLDNGLASKAVGDAICDAMGG